MVVATASLGMDATNNMRRRRRMAPECMDAAFRFLFKYPPLVFQQGDFAWGLSRPVLLAVAAAAGDRGARAADVSGRSSSEGSSARSRRARRAAARRARGAAVLPVPADADPQGGRAAAEFPRRAGRRLAQHVDRRPRRPAAQRVRPAAVGRTERRAARRRCRSGSSLRFFRFSSSADRVGVGRRPEVRRHGDASRRRRSSARATSCPACRSPAW